MVRGYKDKTHRGLDEIYSPVPELEIMRLMLSIAVNKCYKITQLDVVAAF